MKCRFENFQKITNPVSAFLTQKWVKSGQNREHFKNSENLEKMQFFDALTTFVALELEVTAQIKKKWI